MPHAAPDTAKSNSPPLPAPVLEYLTPATQKQSQQLNRGRIRDLLLGLAMTVATVFTNLLAIAMWQLALHEQRSWRLVAAVGLAEAVASLAWVILLPVTSVLLFYRRRAGRRLVAIYGRVKMVLGCISLAAVLASLFALTSDAAAVIAPLLGGATLLGLLFSYSFWQTGQNLTSASDFGETRL